MRQKLFTLFLALAASAGTMFAESGTCGENLTWDLTDGVLTISGTGAMTNYSYSSGTPWYANKESIQTIIINEGVTSIGYHAFDGCNNLTSVVIPNSVTNIGEYAFNACFGLTSVTIPNSVINIGNHAFQGCAGLTSFSIPNSVTSIEEGTFHNCFGMNSITIPNSVTSIGYGAFWNCSGLISVTFPNTITYIGNYAFAGCSSLTAVKIPNSVTKLHKEVFDGCSSLTTVIIGSSVTEIAERAFAYCDSLKYIVAMPENPPTIEIYAFDVNIDAIVFVSNTSISEYRLAPYWKNMNIRERLTTDQSTNSTSATITIVNNFWRVNNDYIASCAIEGGEQQAGNTLDYIGLEPNSEYTDIPVVLTSNTGETETVNVSFFTTALELTTQASKPVSSTTAILLAQTNMSDAETSCGFEYKRNDAPEDMAGTKVYCPVANGQMAGRLKNLRDDTYYKYRAFYQSAAGNMYYGDWQYIFTGDVAVEFDPILYTYAATVIREDEATITGYALAGSEDFTEQGFEYWAESRVPQAENAPVRMPAALNEHFFVQASGIRMTVTLTDLDAGTNYKYRAYGKVGNQYYYGSEQSFTTQGEYVPSTEAIENTSVKPCATKILRNGQVLILRGGKTYTITGAEVK